MENAYLAMSSGSCTSRVDTGLWSDDSDLPSQATAGPGLRIHTCYAVRRREDETIVTVTCCPYPANTVFPAATTADAAARSSAWCRPRIRRPACNPTRRNSVAALRKTTCHVADTYTSDDRRLLALPPPLHGEIVSRRRRRLHSRKSQGSLRATLRRVPELSSSWC